MSSRGVPRCPRVELRDFLRMTRLWDFGLLLQGVGNSERAQAYLQKAVDIYEAALKSVDNTNPGHGPWLNLLVEDKS